MSWTETPEPVDHRTPVDDLEPVCPDAYRLAAVRLRDHLVVALQHIATASNPRLACWAAIHAYGLPMARDTTQTACADRLGVTRQALSKAVTAYCRRVGMPAPLAGKTDSARHSYRARSTGRTRKPQTALT